MIRKTAVIFVFFLLFSACNKEKTSSNDPDENQDKSNSEEAVNEERSEAGDSEEEIFFDLVKRSIEAQNQQDKVALNKQELDE
ncbi:hypothetical protein [Gracilibacillus alcaliphilus]|uniref:hypothetical protein n=1 Tax=Gracilibacillus alcaliphilus TaxID=1401441 RepID=UPI00195B1BF1|nr:hypothetical protein [Gracilibacillus alcaliphilus]MBM7676169.1 putative membrane protein [Gracilibacillus alcaliphilus]